ncbi:FadR/GntR family transcriptional regulator [Brevibacterium aurantiacum]|uniref:FadR family transcriptional regulator n=1 Tax=Brevibacterium aurantiacum TaxID=273384 RepID=A0A4Z0KEQ6_BREAU|nr:FadR/GntR family transcriptional regulator [Brevibacterium aurantiacum]TGD37031.1 FadR family transcriptional regulator [Brevibacterium aurantiacum]
MPARQTRSDTEGNRPTGATLTPLQVPKASDVLASDLREKILSGDFAMGSTLPTERDMVTQTGMSRTTVREALRILEVQGLVSIRTGRAGGAFVQQPGSSSVSDSVDLVIRGRQIKMADLLETREAIEPQCAALAARHRTEDDLTRLDDLNERIGKAAQASLDDFLQANVDWHTAVADASHNELLSGLMRALQKAIYHGTDNEGFVSEEVRRTTVRAHNAVTRAIREGDDDAAVRRMTRHVHSYAEAILAVEERKEVDIDE